MASISNHASENSATSVGAATVAIIARHTATRLPRMTTRVRLPTAWSASRSGQPASKIAGITATPSGSANSHGSLAV